MAESFLVARRIDFLLLKEESRKYKGIPQSHSPPRTLSWVRILELSVVLAMLIRSCRNLTAFAPLLKEMASRCLRASSHA